MLSNGEPVNATGWALSTSDDFIVDGTSGVAPIDPSPAAFVLISSTDALQKIEKMFTSTEDTRIGLGI